MVFIATDANNQHPPDPPQQHAVLVEVHPQDQVISQYGDDSYPQPCSQYPTGFQNQTICPVDTCTAFPNAEVYPSVPLIPDPQVLSYPTYGYPLPTIPQPQLYSPVPGAAHCYPADQPSSAGYSQSYDVNSFVSTSEPEFSTNPFLPQSEFSFPTLSQADPSYQISPSTLPSQDFPVPEVSFLSEFSATNDQNPFTNNDFVNQQPILDLGTEDNAGVQQEYSALPVDNTEYIQSQQAEISRTDSEDSMDVASDIYNNAYTDTVSSVDSTQYLIKLSESDEDVCGEEEVKEIYYNAGFTSINGTENKPEEENVETEADTATNEDEAAKEEMPLLDERADTVARSSDNADQEAVSADQASHLQQIEDYVHHHLIPIAENEVLSLEIQEIEPSSTPNIPSSPTISYTPCIKITNNLTVADESFLFQSQSSLWDPDMGKQGKRAGTMQNLHERSSFLNLTDITKVGRACQRALIYLKDDLTFGSLISLNSMAAKNFTDPTQAVSLIEGCKSIDIIPSTKHRKNVIALSICITLLFIAMGSVRNLQSSLNQEGGVGIISMAVSFVGYMLGSIFSASIVQTFQPRKCIIVNLIPNLLYVAANIYPTLWLMAPVSLIQGISLAIIWNAMSTYITFLSRGRAQKKNESFEKVSSNFFGIFCLIYQSYHIVGNLIASLILAPGSGSTAVPFAINSTLQTNATNITDANNLMPGSESSGVLYELNAPVPVVAGIDALAKIQPNITLMDVNHLRLCGAEFCNHFEIGGSGVTVSDETKYLLFGIYMACIIVAMGIAMFVLEPLNERLFHSTVSPVQRMKQQLVSLCRFSTNIKFLLLLPLLMYSIMQFGFISGEVTMAFVTCPIGIHMVGYTMICFGVCASLSSYISGLLAKWTGRVPLITIGAASNLGVLVFMSVWHPSLDTLVPYFLVMGIWGISDGIWNCQVNSLMGVIFSDKYEEAYAGLRVAQGLGVAILFSYSNSVCMAMKIYIIGAICIVAMIGYLIMEVLLRRMTKQKIVSMKQTSV